jgi:hypothetical protein
MNRSALVITVKTYAGFDSLDLERVIRTKRIDRGCIWQRLLISIKEKDTKSFSPTVLRMQQELQAPN